MPSNKRPPTPKSVSMAKPPLTMPRTSPLLTTPLEVRVQIFDELLPYAVSNHINLLCVCKEFRDEVQHYIYKRPVTFLSQNSFFEWIGKHTDSQKRANLHHVRTLKLKILDIGPDEMQECWMKTAFQEIDSHGSISDLNENPYRLEIGRIISGLQMVPNIVDFTIFKPIKNEHSPTCDIYKAIFTFVKTAYPQLQKLTLHVDKMPLTFLPPLKNLRSLLFTGFSVSSPKETLEYLSKLPNLETLSLFGPPPDLTWKQRTGYKGEKIVHSVTPNVLAKLLPLKSLSMFEIFDEMRDGLAFFTTDMLSSIQETHAESLRYLELSTDPRSAKSVLPDHIESHIESLLNATMCLEHLVLTWMGISSTILDNLPSSLRILEIAAHCGLCPADITDRLICRSPHLPNLVEVIFKVPKGSHGAQNLEASGSNVLSKASVTGFPMWRPLMLILDRELIERRLLAIGCKARWEVWSFAPIGSDQAPNQRYRQVAKGLGGREVAESG